jgi:predicted DNA-binding transcriptional regulator YafY
MEETSVQALTKVIGLMPPRLRRQMDAIRSQTDNLPWRGGPEVDAALLTTLAQACRDDEPIRFTYVARESDPTDRWVEPHRLVTVGRRWYLVAYDRGRQDWRSFRVDRISDPRLTGQRFRPRDLPAPDALSFVQAGLKQRPQKYAVRVRIAAAVADVQAAVQHWGTASGEDGACLLEMNLDSLEWPVVVLLGLDADFTVESPAELVDLLDRASRRFAAAVTP